MNVKTATGSSASNSNNVEDSRGSKGRAMDLTDDIEQPSQQYPRARSSRPRYIGRRLPAVSAFAMSCRRKLASSEREGLSRTGEGSAHRRTLRRKLAPGCVACSSGPRPGNNFSRRVPSV